MSDANQRWVDRLTSARPMLVGLRRAGDVIDGLDDGLILHAGPPQEPGDLAGPALGSVVGALILEGRASSVEEAELMIAAGEIRLAPTHDHRAVGPMAGTITASMPVFEVVDHSSAATAYVTINEGLGRVLRYGANDAGVIDRLRWLEAVVAPALDDAIRSVGGLDLVEIVTEALNRGDECHNRNKAATAQLVRTLAAPLVEAAPATAAEILRFMAGNDHFFLNLSMACGKAAVEAAGHEPDAMVVTTISSNGRQLGIRVAGAGDTWFVTDAPRPQTTRWLDGFGPDDAFPVMGDSFVTEVTGLGAFAGAAAPAIATYVGGSVEVLSSITESMYEITTSEHPTYRIPSFDFRGTPVGIDVAKVVATGTTPGVNAGFASREAGVGQAGAGLVRLPIECFEAAADHFARAGADR